MLKCHGPKICQYFLEQWLFERRNYGFKREKEPLYQARKFVRFRGRTAFQDTADLPVHLLAQIAAGNQQTIDRITHPRVDIEPDQPDLWMEARPSARSGNWNYDLIKQRD